MAALFATPLLAQSDGSAPKTPEQCRSYAAQQANEEYLSQRTTNRETSPFARSPSGMRDPLQQSADQKAAIDRTGREQQLYDDCVAKLGKQ
jgi:hypothetical protein